MIKTKRLLLKILGLIVCIAPVVITTLGYFPLWKERGAQTLLSGFTVFVLFICIYPIIKLLKMVFRSPSIWLTWLIIFILFTLVERIADEMTVISFVGFISNSIGALIFKLSEGSKINEEPS